jgi:hypothetical protein
MSCRLSGYLWAPHCSLAADRGLALNERSTSSRGLSATPAGITAYRPDLRIHRRDHEDVQCCHEGDLGPALLIDEPFKMRTNLGRSLR